MGIVPTLLCFLFLACTSEYHAEKTETKEQASILNIAVLLSSVFLFAYTGIETAFGGLISSFAVQWLHTDEATSAWLASVFWSALCINRIIAALLTSHIDHTRYILAHLVLSVLAASAFIPSAVAPNAYGLIPVMLATGALGFALAPLYPGMLLVAEEMLAEPLSGRAGSIIITSAALGEMVLPTGIAWSFEVITASFVWIQLAVVCLLLVVFMIAGRHLLCPSTSAKSQQDPEP